MDVKSVQEELKGMSSNAFGVAELHTSTPSE